ncbi:MAG: CRTAC1 family protein [Nitrospira sp.]|nr:MAG: CRTAC1 family protein [Nitrospira sp.]
MKPSRMVLFSLLALAHLGCPRQDPFVPPDLFYHFATYTVGKNPTAVVTADLNEDGMTDLITTNISSNSLSVLFGNGDGTFKEPMQIDLSKDPRALTLDDFNGDGHLDMAVACSGSDQVAILYGLPQGQFGIGQRYAVHRTPVSIASGDLNGDRKPDLAVALRNDKIAVLLGNGDGTFRNASASIAGPPLQWAVSATFFDYDRDGWLDLYVTQYVDVNVAKPPLCYAKSSAHDYCGPDAFAPLPDRLFHNNGDGTFADVSQPSGIQSAKWAGLGVVASDLNNDGWVDLYVANDGDPNFLWINQKNGTFKDEALWAGCAVNRMGMPEASMGVDAGDFDGDGDDDLVMTHLMDETNTFYTNLGNGLFTDRTIQIGLTTTTGRYTGFGGKWMDYDNDGWLDLLIVNGAVRTLPDAARQGDRYPLRQPKQLLRGHEGQRLVDVSAQAGPALTVPEVSRGAAFGDVDNDGDTDVLVLNSNGLARLFLNQVGTRHHWIGVRVVGAKGQRDMLGARVEVVREGKPSLWRRVQTDGSYASASDARVLVGLGAEAAVKAVRVHWPDGQIESWAEVAIDRYTMLRQGTGK